MLILDFPAAGDDVVVLYSCPPSRVCFVVNGR